MFTLHDLRNAFRQLARRPAFTSLTVVVLAGGLAVSIFTFSFLYTAMQGTFRALQPEWR